ncbi:NitT/TauT family transport system substrate-binding protein [Neorhizobium galegae]|uniref:ABC transporter substrate-binding protein n=1 Tax=Neorhizobium galegae TaxID=399 RepID=UPI002787D4B7|nr:ABC transporter substrate-binding protein [Neorhizobium galegae]MDQ0133819.1 NitT/TauT family transport system substrate-binding protein [Neorhizobium galegae]
MNDVSDFYKPSLNRRRFLAATGLGAAFVAVGPANAQGRTALRIQYDWLIDNAKIGEIVALQRGFFKDDGIDLTISPGGPNAQTVPPVLANQAQAGQMGSNQVLAACGEGIPLKMFATTYQNAPLVYVSLPRAPVRKPADLVGKKVAVTPNGRWLMNLMLTVNNIDASKVEIVTAGADLSPLLLGQADVGVGFSTNTKALSVLGADRILMSAKDAGIPYYTGTYFTSAEDYDKRKDGLKRFVRAVGKGWQWAYENRRDAVNIMCDAYPNMDREVEHQTVDTVMNLAFSEDTKTFGWGWIDSKRMQEEIDLFNKGGGFKNRVPDLGGVMTQEILEQTADARPRFG